MYEKIVAKLKLQRGTTSNVSDRSLEDLAKSLVAIITDDSILEKADLSAAIASIDGNINHYTAESMKKASADLEKEKAKKAAGEASKKAAEEASKAKDSDDVPAWAKTIMEQNQKLTEDLNGLKTEKVTTSREDALKKTLQGLPEFYSKPILEAFKNTNFESDDKFNEYLTSTNTNSQAFQQAAKEHGLPTSIPSADVKKPVETGETSELGEARAVLQKQKETQKT